MDTRNDRSKTERGAALDHIETIRPLMATSPSPTRVASQGGAHTSVAEFDVFVSYASADRDRVAPIAQALADHGWSVWWDRRIQPGKTFDDVIEAALDEAKAVVCVWTDAGIASRWVRTEAAEGAARGILVPVLLDDVRIPLAFRRIQAADLRHWEPGRDHAGFAELIAALEELVDTAPARDEAQPLELEERVEQGPSVVVARSRAVEKDWEGVIAVLGPLEAKVPGSSTPNSEARELLAMARRKRDAAALYEEAEVLYAEGRWREVVARFDRILELDPDVEYGSDLRQRASRHIEEDREQRLTNAYVRATEALNASEWNVAVAWFEQLLAEEPDYRDATAKLAQARVGSIAENRYSDLQETLETRQWDGVVAGTEELTKTAPDHSDPEDLLAKAPAQIDGAERETGEAERRAETLQATGPLGRRIARIVIQGVSLIGLFGLIVALSSVFGEIARDTWNSVSVDEEASAVARVGLVPGALYGLAYGVVLRRVFQSRRSSSGRKRTVLVVAGATLGGLIIGYGVFGVSELIAGSDLDGPLSFFALALGIVSIAALIRAGRRSRRHRPR